MFYANLASALDQLAKPVFYLPVRGLFHYIQELSAGTPG